MNKRYIEYDMTQLLNDASVEEMDEILKDINPADFSCPNDISQRRIKRSVLKKLNLDKKSKKKKSGLRAAIGTAAAIALLTTTFTFSAEAREIMKKFFAFIPGQGVVETDIPYYVLSESVIREANDDVVIEISNVTVDSKEVKVEYKVNLVKVDILEAQNFLNEKDPQAALEKYYADLGYEKYFEIGTDMKAISSLSVKGDKLDRINTESFFGETSGNKYLTVTDVYKLGGIKAEDIKEAVLALGDISAEFTLVEAKQYDSMEAVLQDRVICVRGGITIVCEPKRVEDELRASFYVVDTGDYSEVENLFPYFAEGAGVYLDIDGKRIEGELMPDDVNPNTVVFDVAGYDENTPCSIHISKVLAKKSDTVELDISKESTIYDEFSLNVVSIVPQESNEDYVVIGEFENPGDIVKVSVTEKFYESSKHLINFNKANKNDEPLYINEEDAIMAVNKEPGSSNIIYLEEPEFLLDYNFVFYVNR